MSKPHDPQHILQTLLDAARAQGADAADALLVENVSASVSYRLGRLEDIERSEGADLGLRVFVGSRVAFVSSSDFSAEAVAALPARALTMARLAPEDKFAGLAPSELLARDIPKLDLEDPEEPAAELLVARAREAEQAGLSVPGVTNSEGGGASFSRGRHHARHQHRLSGPLCRHQPQVSASRCWRAKAPAWSATMTMPAPVIPVTSEAPKRSAAARAKERSAGSIPAKSNRRTCPSCSTPARRAGCWATSPAPFPAPAWRAAPAS